MKKDTSVLLLTITCAIIVWVSVSAIWELLKYLGA